MTKSEWRMPNGSPNDRMRDNLTVVPSEVEDEWLGSRDMDGKAGG